MTNPSKPSPHYAPARETRVAAALRENLRKRKQQAQTRADQTENSKDT
jgi:hypothetical protein